MRSYGFQITAEDIIDAGYLINKEISFDEAEEYLKILDLDKIENNVLEYATDLDKQSEYAIEYISKELKKISSKK